MKKNYVYALLTIFIWSTMAAIVGLLTEVWTPFLSLIVSAIVLKEKIELRAIVALIFIIGGILVQSFYELIQQKKER